MYLCTNCNIIPEQKPYYNHCNYCGENSNIIDIKPKDITISEMIINYDNNIVTHFIPKIITNEMNRSDGLLAITRHIPNSNNNNIFRLGFLYNKMEDFLKLSKYEIDNICMIIYKKHNISQMVHPVIVKSSINDNYMIVPMTISSIVDWHRNNDIKFEGIYYKKCVWALETINNNDIYSELLKQLKNNTSYSFNAMSSNILNF